MNGSQLLKSHGISNPDPALHPNGDQTPALSGIFVTIEPSKPITNIEVVTPLYRTIIGDRRVFLLTRTESLPSVSQGALSWHIRRPAQGNSFLRMRWRRNAGGPIQSRAHGSSTASEDVHFAGLDPETILWLARSAGGTPYPERNASRHHD